MFNSPKFNSLILAPALALLMAFFSITSASAHTTIVPEDLSPKTESITQAKAVIIIIVIVIKKKKKGVAEVVDIYPASSKSQELADNEILAQATVEGDHFNLKALRGTHARSLLILPSGFKASSTLSVKAGQPNGFSLKAGKVDFRSSKLGNFEIQD